MRTLLPILALLTVLSSRGAELLTITISRQYPATNCTSGYLGVNGAIICYTLERPWKDNQQNISSIPAGTYPAILRYDKSDHWRLQLEQVPGRSGVQIHIGNEVDESKGCILVGKALGPDLCTLIDSTAAYNALKRAFYESESPNATPNKTIKVIIQDAGPR